jgi:hypothetical protein
MIYDSFLKIILKLVIYLGAWSLAQVSDAKSIEVSLILCLIKQELNHTQFLTNELSPTMLSNIVSHLNLTQSELLLACDRENRAHSQQWLVYSYLQTGKYRKSVNVLTDLVLSNEIYPFDNYYLPYIYGARAFLVIHVFFWSMYEKENNQDIFTRTMDEILFKMDSNPIRILTDNMTDNSSFQENEILARFGMSQI